MRRTISFAALALVVLAGCTSKPAASTRSGSPNISTSSSAAVFLQKLRTGYTDQKFRVTYRFIEPPNGTEWSLTEAQDPPKRSFKAIAGGLTRLAVEDVGGIVLCDSGSPRCSRSTGRMEDLPGPSLEYFSPLLDLRDFVESTSVLTGFSSKGSQTVAGRAATCAAWTYHTGTVQVCADNETGVVLSSLVMGYLSPSQPSAVFFNWSATAFDSPTAADFKATAPVG